MRSFSSLVSLLFLAPSVLLGGHVLEYETQVARTSFITHETTTSTWHATAFVGSQRSRIDEWSFSYIMRADLGKFWVVVHGAKTYWEFDLPVQLEDEVAEGSRRTLEEGLRLGTALVDVKPTGEAEKIGGRQARLWRASVQQPLAGLTRDLEVWVATVPDLPSYRELKRNVVAFNPLESDWKKEILTLEGLEVKYEEKSRSSARSETVTRTLVSVREEPLEKELFEIPEGYERTEFPLDAMFSIATPQEMPSREP